MLVGAGTSSTRSFTSLLLTLKRKMAPATRMATPQRRAAMMSLRVLTEPTVASRRGNALRARRLVTLDTTYAQGEPGGPG